MKKYLSILFVLSLTFNGFIFAQEEQEESNEYCSFNENLKLAGSNELTAEQNSLASTKLRARVTDTAGDKMLKLGFRGLLRAVEDDNDKSKPRPSLKKLKKKMLSGRRDDEGSDNEDDDGDDDDGEDDTKGDLLKKAVACKKL